MCDPGPSTPRVGPIDRGRRRGPMSVGDVAWVEWESGCSWDARSGAATVTVGSTPAVRATVVDTAAELSQTGDSEPSGPATSNPDDRDDSQVVEATLPGSSETDESLTVTAEDDDSETLAFSRWSSPASDSWSRGRGHVARRPQPPDAGPDDRGRCPHVIATGHSRPGGFNTGRRRTTTTLSGSPRVDQVAAVDHLLRQAERGEIRPAEGAAPVAGANFRGLVDSCVRSFPHVHEPQERTSW